MSSFQFHYFAFQSFLFDLIFSDTIKIKIQNFDYKNYKNHTQNEKENGEIFEKFLRFPSGSLRFEVYPK